MMIIIMMTTSPEKVGGLCFQELFILPGTGNSPFPTWEGIFVEPKIAFGFSFRINVLFQDRHIKLKFPLSDFFRNLPGTLFWRNSIEASL